MARAVTSFRLWLGIERRAEVVSTSAAVYDSQFRYLGNQLKLALLLQKLFKLTGQQWEYFGKQHGMPCSKDVPHSSTTCSLLVPMEIKSWLTRKPEK